MYTFKILLEIVKFLSKNIAVTMFGMLVHPLVPNCYGSCVRNGQVTQAYASLDAGLVL